MSATDGGFDPVAVPANAGDAVTVLITDSTGMATTITATVKEAARPRVVRTRPAPRRTDVPINAIIRVVFSAPMALQSVKDGVRLTQAGLRVAAEVMPGDATGVAYDLMPEQELVPGTDYAIEIASAVEDVNGVPMGAAVTTPFTTAANPDAAPVASIVIADDWGPADPHWEVNVGDNAAVYAQALAADLTQIKAAISLSTDHPEMVQFSAPQETRLGWTVVQARGVDRGRATITARAGNASASGVITVYQVLDPRALLAGAKVLTVYDLFTSNLGHIYSTLILLFDGTPDMPVQIGVVDDHLRHGSPMGAVTGHIALDRAFWDWELRRIDSQRVIIRAPDRSEISVPTGAVAQFCPSWSPDGSQLTFTQTMPSGSFELVILSLQDMTLRVSPIADTEQASLRCARWTLDGSGIGLTGPLPGSINAIPVPVSGRRYTNYVWNLDGSGWRSRGSGPEVEVDDGTRLSDGRWLTSRNDSIWVMTPDSLGRAYIAPGHSATFTH